MVEHWPSILEALGWIPRTDSLDQQSLKLSEPKLSTFCFFPLKFISQELMHPVPCVSP